MPRSERAALSARFASGRSWSASRASCNNSPSVLRSYSLAKSWVGIAQRILKQQLGVLKTNEIRAKATELMLVSRRKALLGVLGVLGGESCVIGSRNPLCAPICLLNQRKSAS